MRDSSGIASTAYSSGPLGPVLVLSVPSVSFGPLITSFCSPVFVCSREIYVPLVIILVGAYLGGRRPNSLSLSRIVGVTPLTRLLRIPIYVHLDKGVVEHFLNRPVPVSMSYSPFYAVGAGVLLALV